MTKPEGYEGYYADAATEARRTKMRKEYLRVTQEFPTTNNMFKTDLQIGFEAGYEAACASKQKEIDALQSRIDSLHAELGIDL